MAEYDSRIPERLQLLRVGLGGADDLDVFAYYPSAQQTNWSVPSFCLGPADEDVEFIDVHGTIEKTLHDLLDNGGTPDDVRRIMGLVQESELDGDVLESDAYTSIDLGWCIEGYLFYFERVPPESSDVHDIFSDEQIANIEAEFDVMPAAERLNKAEQVAHDLAEAGGEPVKRPADLHVGKWRVHLVYEGDHYGLTGSLTYGDVEGNGYPYIGQRINDCQIYGHGLPLVEFYDTSQDPARFPGGQFVSRYYMSTLLGMDNPSDDIREVAARGDIFGLDGSVPAWKVGSEDLKAVGDYLQAAREALGKAETERPDRALGGVAKESRAAREGLAEDGRGEHIDPER